MNTPSPSEPDPPGRLGKRDAERLARRERLLDTAERRFADVGYEATGLRDVTTAAGTRLASVAEEFGGKEQLFREVLVRRALPLEADRLDRLAAIPRTLHGQQRVAAIVDAFVDPVLARVDGGGSDVDGWRNYCRFIAQLAHSRHMVQFLVEEDYNRLAFRFIEEFRDTYPRAADAAPYDGYLLLLAATLDVFADSFRMDSLSGGRFHSADLRLRCDALRTFTTAGITALLSA